MDWQLSAKIHTLVNMFTLILTLPGNGKLHGFAHIVTRAQKICSTKFFNVELKTIKKFAFWNKYPKKVVNSIIKRILSQSAGRECGTSQVENAQKVFLNIHYAGDIGDQLIKHLWRKFKRCINGNVNFITMYSVTKMSFFTIMKDRIRFLSKFYVVYKFTYPGCTASYIGMTKTLNVISTNKRTLVT